MFKSISKCNLQQNQDKIEWSELLTNLAIFEEDYIK